MNICLIGDFSGNSDEGMKLVAQNLAITLSENQKILRVDIHEAARFSGWRRLGRFHPDVLHYVSGPSPMSFMILRALLLGCRFQSCGRVKTVMSATQPWLPYNSISFLKKLKPDLFLIQSDQTSEYFRKLGFQVGYLPNGVDVNRFKPVNASKKQELRAKYGLSDRKFIAIHIGSVRKRRGIDVMKSVAKMKDWTVLIVGTTSSPFEKQLYVELVESGCIVWRKYIKAINEIYQLADIYVFPVEKRLGCIEVPLSVLEAMACNLAVVTTKFGGFPKLFTEGDGFFFVNNRQEIPEKIKVITEKSLLNNVQTRMKVLPYSWDNISKRLSQYYRELINSKS